MNYWLLCLPREDILNCMKEGTFGLSRKVLIGQVRKGDRIVCCAGKGDWKIVGLGTATSDYYVDDSKLFLKEGIFPDRFDIKAVSIPSEREVDIKSILDKLSFVKDLAFWAVSFRIGIVKLSKSDWDLISEKTDVSQAGLKLG